MFKRFLGKIKQKRINKKFLEVMRMMPRLGDKDLNDLKEYIQGIQAWRKKYKA